MYNFEKDMLPEIVKMDKVINGQIKHELSSWLRLIEFFRQENALLKYRLSELVDNNDDRNFLQIAEYFQNEFLLKDDTLKKLLKSVRQYLDWLEDGNENASVILNNHHVLRDEILVRHPEHRALLVDRMDDRPAQGKERDARALQRELVVLAHRPLDVAEQHLGLELDQLIGA